MSLRLFKDSLTVLVLGVLVWEEVRKNTIPDAETIF